VIPRVRLRRCGRTDRCKQKQNTSANPVHPRTVANPPEFHMNARTSHECYRASLLTDHLPASAHANRINPPKPKRRQAIVATCDLSNRKSSA
jgi:hypothetical protein